VQLISVLTIGQFRPNCNMRNYIRAHRVITTFCVFGALLASSWPSSLAAPVRGCLDARRDIRQGRYLVLGYGLPTPWRPEYARCLRERYNISFRPVAGCVVSESLISYVDAYHSVVDEAVRRKFGRNVFRECADNAVTNWKAQRQAIRDARVNEGQ
jgi:hypothetical protein